MQRNFGIYPPYPRIWDNTKSRRDNEDNEKNEPGNPSAADFESLELEDSSEDTNETTSKPYPKEVYPEWYWPALENLDSPEIPQLNVPPWDRPLLQVTPNDTAGHCGTAESSPKLDDCYEALGSLYDSMTMTPPLAGGEGWYWPGVS